MSRGTPSPCVPLTLTTEYIYIYYDTLRPSRVRITTSLVHHIEIRGPYLTTAQTKTRVVSPRRREQYHICIYTYIYTLSDVRSPLERGVDRRRRNIRRNGGGQEWRRRDVPTLFVGIQRIRCTDIPYARTPHTPVERHGIIIIHI